MGYMKTPKQVSETRSSLPLTLRYAINAIVYIGIYYFINGISYIFFEVGTISLGCLYFFIGRSLWTLHKTFLFIARFFVGIDAFWHFIGTRQYITEPRPLDVQVLYWDFSLSPAHSALYLMCRCIFFSSILLCLCLPKNDRLFSYDD